MTITLGTSGTTVALAASGDCVESITLDGQSLVQAVQLMRAETAKPINRGNRLRTLTFTVKRQPLANAILATTAMFNLENALAYAARGPDLVLVFGSGAITCTVTFANATIAARHRAPGTSGITDYTITAGSYAVT
jgi:hypothetical protein